MKKIISVLFLVAAFAVCGSVNAFAIPTINGVIDSPTEWANADSFNSSAAYPYYLNIPGPVAPNDAIKTMVITNVVVLQELAAPAAQDGIYMLVQVQSPGPQLTYPNPALYPGVPSMTNEPLAPPQLEMTGDFAGTGSPSDLQIFIDTRNSNPGGPIDDPALDTTLVCIGTTAYCSTSSNYTNLVTDGGKAARVPGAGGVLEYFFPSSLETLYGYDGLGFTQFPTSFVGTILYHNGISSTGGTGSGDDVVSGTLAPEPSTMLLMLAGFLGLVSKKRFLA